MIWEDSYLLKLLEEAEKEVSTKVPCVFHRFSINIQKGVAVYDLPSGIIGIKRISWKGHTVWPAELNELQNLLNFRPLESPTPSDRPLHYIRSPYGYQRIKFWATPNEDIIADDRNLDGLAISQRVIISCWREATPNNENFQIPDYMRRQLLRYYAMSRAYLKEGKGQNIQASQYFENKFNFSLSKFKKVFDNIYRSRLMALSPRRPSIIGIPRPKLPTNYGTVID